MSKLTDIQRKQIIAEYVAGDGKVTHRGLATKYQVSPSAIAKVLSQQEVKQKCVEKKEENTQTMLAFLGTQNKTAQSLIQTILDTSAAQIQDASLRDKMGALKILSDVFVGRVSVDKESVITEHLSLMRNAFADQSKEQDVEDNGDE